jgi:hypothetical protein
MSLKVLARKMKFLEYVEDLYVKTYKVLIKIKKELNK